MTENAVVKHRATGSVFVRLIGVLLLLMAGLSLLGAFGIIMPLSNTVRFLRTAHETYPLGLWRAWWQENREQFGSALQTTP